MAEQKIREARAQIQDLQAHGHIRLP